MTHDDILRELTRRLAQVDVAMEAHRTQMKGLASTRRDAVTQMIDVARRAGERQPQAYVAGLLGISQQRVSKILKGN